MMLMAWGAGASPHIVVVVGGGLIGTAAAGALARRGATLRATLPLDWNDRPLQDRQLATLEQQLSRSDAAGPPPPLALLWSAGRAGFAAGEREVAAELHSFRAVMALAIRLAARRPLVFHLVSSAGGLFEGQRQVGAMSAPLPRRPYSRLKQTQEEILLASGLRSRIYRPSSVYGFVHPGHRIGLVPLLLLNGIRQQPTYINGGMSTLRDFVFAGDVGEFIARSVLAAGGPGASPVILASAKPTSLWEVLHLVESVVGRRLHVSYSLVPANAEDTTFAASTQPSGWEPGDIAANARRIYRRAITDGAAFPPPQHWA